MLNLRRLRHWREPAFALAPSCNLALGAPQFDAPQVCTVLSHVSSAKKMFYILVSLFSHCFQLFRFFQLSQFVFQKLFQVVCGCGLRVLPLMKFVCKRCRAQFVRSFGLALNGAVQVDSACLDLRWVVLSRFRSSVCIRLFELVILLFAVFICFRTPFYFEFGCFVSCFVFFLEVLVSFNIVLNVFWSFQLLWIVFGFRGCYRLFIY